MQSFRLPDRAFQLFVATLLISCSSCGNSGSDGGPSKSCVPQCTGKSCGDNGCGGRCGACDDSNPCTDDTCDAQGQCQLTPKPDSFTGTGLQLNGCKSGQPKTYDCLHLCKDAGYNEAIGSGLPGAAADKCTCESLSSACASARRSCYDSTTEQGCDASAGMWYAVDCTGYCKSRHYEGALGCRSPFGCTCKDSVVINGKTYPCGGFGAACGGTSLCCSGLACTWEYNGGDSYYACEGSTSCAPQCMEGSVCCGGAFCAGNCIGNPCCS